MGSLVLYGKEEEKRGRDTEMHVKEKEEMHEKETMEKLVVMMMM